MRSLGLALAAVMIIATTAAGADGRVERSLKMLAPAERLEQLCDYTAMARIREQSKDYRPDRAVANAMAEPVATGDTNRGHRRRLSQPQEMVCAVLPLHGDTGSPERGRFPLHHRRGNSRSQVGIIRSIGVNGSVRGY